MHRSSRSGVSASSSIARRFSVNRDVFQVRCVQRLTMKSDVYSFGVVLLELVTGKKPTTSRFSGFHSQHPQGQGARVGKTKENLRIIDPRIGGSYNLQSVWKAVEIALLKGTNGPDMQEIVEGLCTALQYQSQYVGTPITGILRLTSLLVTTNSSEFIMPLKTQMVELPLMPGMVSVTCREVIYRFSLASWSCSRIFS